MTEEEIIAQALERLSVYNAQTLKLVVRDVEYSLEEVLRDQGYRYDAISIFDTAYVRWEIDEYVLETNDDIFWVANSYDLKMKSHFESPDASTYSPSQRAFERNPKVAIRMQAIFEIIYETIRTLDTNV